MGWLKNQPAIIQDDHADDIQSFTIDPMPRVFNWPDLWAQVFILNTCDGAGRFEKWKRFFEVDFLLNR